MWQVERNIPSELKLTMVRDRKTSYSEFGLKKTFVLQANSLNVSSKEIDMKSFYFSWHLRLDFSSQEIRYWCMLFFKNYSLHIFIFYFYCIFSMNLCSILNLSIRKIKEFFVFFSLDILIILFSLKISNNSIHILYILFLNELI